MHRPPLPADPVLVPCGERIPGAPPGSAWSGTHYFEAAAHRDTVVQCIHDGVLPLRFAYAGSAAFTHDLLARTSGYQSVIGSVELEIVTLAKSGLPLYGLPGIVDIGPGNGDHTVEFLRSLTTAGITVRSYLGLDFSATLLAIACSRVQDEFGGFAVASETWDIEASACDAIERWRALASGPGPLLVCLLGHTLGNLQSEAAALTYVHDSLRADDVLLAGLSLQHPRLSADAAVAPYLNGVFQAAALEPLWAAGINPYDIEFGVQYVDGRIIGEVRFVRSVKIGAETLPSGHTVQCFSSRRFTIDDALALFATAGWRVRSAVVDEGREHAVILAVRGAS